MNFEEKTIGETLVYEGLIIDVRNDEAKMPDGTLAPRELVLHPGGVGIAMEDEDGKFFFVRQWRYAQKCVTLEYPAGKKEAGEDPFTTAQREIVEEVGYEGKDWYCLGKMYPTPAYDTEVIDLYYCKKGEFRGQHFDDDEFLNVEKYSLQEITEMIVNGTIPDAKTICMTFLIKENKEKGNI